MYIIYTYIRRPLLSVERVRARCFSLALQQVAGASRATVNASTGETPNKIMLWRQTMQPIDLLMNCRSEVANPEDESTIVKSLTEHLA